MAKEKKVTNGGSAIGEAIGDLLEEQVHIIFRDIEAKNHVYFLTRYGKTKSGKECKKLLLPDELGNEYNMDGVVISEEGFPLILLESKYIRYKKHNRDKASWICNAHTAVRKRFPSIRSSVAVLAGSWSSTSLAMLASYGVTYFIIPFNSICDILSKYNVDFEWEENDYDKALLISPLDKNCEKRFAYSVNGKIEPSDLSDQGAEYTIKLLALNDERLKKAREEAMWTAGVFYAQGEKERETLIKQYSNPADGKRVPFCNAILYQLRKDQESAGSK